MADTTIKKKWKMADWLFDTFRLNVLNEDPRTVMIEFTEGKYKGFIFTTSGIAVQALEPEDDQLSKGFTLYADYSVTHAKTLYEVNAFDRAARECIRKYVERFITKADAEKRDSNS